MFIKCLLNVFKLMFSYIYAWNICLLLDNIFAYLITSLLKSENYFPLVLKDNSSLTSLNQTPYFDISWKHFNICSIYNA